jgi:ATP-dependent RNA helicase MSS116
MTKVQHESMPQLLEGKDALVKAKTGTGKTLGFLIPAVEILNVEKRAQPHGGSGGVDALRPPRVLILSPTRELASQIATEARQLCTFHRMGVVLLVGGTNMNTDVRNLERPAEGFSDIIVATPGRLVAHINETPGVARQLMGVKVLVLDEADRLLDMGFEKDIATITQCLQKRPASMGYRQTMLFSATVSKEVQKIASATLRQGHCYIDAVGESDEAEQTHEHVPQSVMTVPMNSVLKAVVYSLEQHMAENPDAYKIIVFLGTAREAQFYSNLLNQVGFNALEIHSRLSQSKRTKASEQFRTGRKVIMLSSDVSARGMDYPDVSFVLQIGSTSLEQYIHRLGRTARAGKGGSGLLILSTFESRFMLETELSSMPLIPVPCSPALLSGGNAIGGGGSDSTAMSPKIQQLGAVMRELTARDAADEMHGEDSLVDQARLAWCAWLGATNSMLRKLSMNKDDLVALSRQYFASIGLSQMPALLKKTVGKMGLQVCG